MRKLEICCYSIESCLAAGRNGADRIELCSGPAEGGVTPSAGLIRQALRVGGIPVHPIVRPRGGDFLYSEEEFRVLLRDVEQVRELGCPGLVTGMLTPDGEVDVARMKEVKALAGGLEITFHRAMDVCANPFAALETLIGLGIERVLTSGQAPSAPLGKDLIKEMQARFGRYIIIMPGAGIRSGNLREMAEYTGANEFHSSASSLRQSGMRFRNTRVNMGGADQSEFQWQEADPQEIARMAEALMAP